MLWAAVILQAALRDEPALTVGEESRLGAAPRTMRAARRSKIRLVDDSANNEGILLGGHITPIGVTLNSITGAFKTGGRSAGVRPVQSAVFDVLMPSDRELPRQGRGLHPKKYPRCFVSPKLEAGDRPAEDAITIGSLALGHPRLARPRQTGN